MKKNRTNIVKIVISLIFPSILALIIHISTYFPSFIERYYSTIFYDKISSALRIITQKASFSIGDCLYVIMSIALIYRFIHYTILLYKAPNKKNVLVNGTVKTVRNILFIYILFMLIWGLNYSRKGIAYQLNVAPLPYTTEDLCQLSQKIIISLNDCRNKLDSVSYKDTSLLYMYGIAEKAYTASAIEYPFLNFKHSSIKKSLFTPWASWFGYSGYYNPFSGEAQLRTDLPAALLPFIACHETAHQLGYADESEASFVALVVAENAGDVYLKYSAMIDLYRFTRNELYLRNTYPDGPVKLNKNVKDDLIYIREFFQKESFKQSKTINTLYDNYLKFNGLEKGIETYNDVVAWAIEWYKLEDKNKK